MWIHVSLSIFCPCTRFLETHNKLSSFICSCQPSRYHSPLFFHITIYFSFVFLSIQMYVHNSCRHIRFIFPHSYVNTDDSRQSKILYVHWYTHRFLSLTFYSHIFHKSEATSFMHILATFMIFPKVTIGSCSHLLLKYSLFLLHIKYYTHINIRFSVHDELNSRRKKHDIS